VSDRVYVPGYGYVDSGTPAPKKDKKNFTFTPPNPTTTASTGSPREPAYLRYDIAYRPPVWGTADRMEQQIPSLPLIYRAQNSGDLREAYWSDPASKAIIQAAARAYYRDYPNYSDQWAEGFWQKDIMNAAISEGAPPAWQMLQQIFSEGVTASESPDGSTPGGYPSGGGGYGGGGGATSERIDLASPTQAQALLTQFMQSAVGRDPKANEVSRFLELLQDYQRNNPMVVSANGSTVTQSGGIDAGVVAQEFVETLPDYTESQADRYYRTFMSALLGGA
jgi:hypothetical protein